MIPNRTDRSMSIIPIMITHNCSTSTTETYFRCDVVYTTECLYAKEAKSGRKFINQRHREQNPRRPEVQVNSETEIRDWTMI